MMADYIAYARTKCFPKITREAADQFEKEYLGLIQFVHFLKIINYLFRFERVRT